MKYLLANILCCFILNISTASFVLWLHSLLVNGPSMTIFITMVVSGAIAVWYAYWIEDNLT